MTKEGLLTVQDVVEILNVSRRTIYNWIKDGKITPTRIGKLYRFYPDEIQKFVDGGRVDHSKKMKILAVDDDLLVRKSLQILLEKSGYEVTVVENGHLAVQKSKDENFDLVLTDVRMPGMNGLDTLKTIREQRRLSGKNEVAEVVMSGYEDENARKQMKELGVQNFVRKPFEWNDFLQTLQKSLN